MTITDDQLRAVIEEANAAGLKASIMKPDFGATAQDYPLLKIFGGGKSRGWPRRAMN